jgi:prophage regulatory protein
MSSKPTTPKAPISSSIPTAKTSINHSVFDALPDSAFIRESQLVQSPKRPETPAPLPFSAPTLWRKVKAGTFPKPIKLSERVTAWNVGTVRAWMTAQAMA